MNASSTTTTSTGLEVVQNSIALLLCFDQVTNKVISHVLSMDATALGHMVTEASYVIHCLHMRNLLASPQTPLLFALC
jgi:hypothetical protein